MTTAAEIQKAITDLPKSEYDKLIHWLHEYDWEKWEEEFDEDVRAGKLDALAAKALEAKARGELRDL